MFVLALAAASASAAPVALNKRIAQVISASTAKWEQACLAAGGADKCNPVSVTAFTTLLAAAGPCEQQDSADAMIDLAKTLGSDATMISLSQIFAQQPRNTPNSLYVPYCQTAPKNSELDGLFQCQFQGASSTTFVGGLAVGAAGTIPFGQTEALSPAGSCKANPDGPIADGTQLVDLTTDPGVDSGSGSGSGSASSTKTSTKKSTATATATATESDVSATETATATTTDSAATATSTDCSDDGSDGSDDGSDGSDDSGDSSSTDEPTPTDSSSVDEPTATPTDVATSAAAPTSSAAAGDFHLTNGQDAQKLNAKFATLTTSSTCTEGEQACVADGFAQCVGGTFVSTPCSGGTVCVALPLVNKKGTSITCDTKADALARIAATGATGGLTG